MLARIGLIAFAVGSMMLFSLPRSSLADPYQAHPAFEAAIRNSSTSDSLVLITAIDDRTGKTTTGCTGASLLRGGNLRREVGNFFVGTRTSA